MKKFFLFALLAIASLATSAQNYTATAHGVEDEEWGASYDSAFTPEQVTVEGYEGYVILRGWAGVEGHDLKVTYDADQNVTSLTPIKEGVEGKTYTSGYAAAYTGLPDFPSAQFYLGEGYDYATGSAEYGYVFLSLFLYDANDEYTWDYYYIEWGEWTDEDAPLYTVIAKGQPDEDWAPLYEGALLPEAVEVEGYEGYLILRGWAGVEGHDLIVAYNDDEEVTSVTAVEGDVVGTPVTDGYVGALTGLADKYYAQILVQDSYGYAGGTQEEGYVTLSMYLYDANDDASFVYYNIVWGDTGIESIVTPADSPVEFYTIQGIRVERPSAAGIYIVRSAGNASKVIIR